MALLLFCGFGLALKELIVGGGGGSNPYQSNANGTSPATRSYTLTVSNAGGSDTENITVSSYNDNTHTNGWDTSFTNLDPSTQVTVTLGTLAGVDMPTTISTSGSGNFIGLNNSFGGSVNFSNGQAVKLRTTTLPFNTSMSGVGANATFGNVNNKVVTVTTPSGSFDVTFQTRAPRIKEDFNYADTLNTFPYEDIDLVTNNPVEYAVSAQVDVDDIEIAQEIKASDPDVQVSINNGNWQNVREL